MSLQTNIFYCSFMEYSEIKNTEDRIQGFCEYMTQMQNYNYDLFCNPYVTSTGKGNTEWVQDKTEAPQKFVSISTEDMMI